MAVRRRLLLSFAFLSLVMTFVSCYGPVWLHHPTTTYGLWKYCSSSTGICHAIPSSNTKHQAVQTFSILSCLAAFFGTFCAFLSYKTEKTNGVMASLFLIACVLCSVIALGLYTSENESLVRTEGAGIMFGWSYIVAWLGTGLAFVGIVLGFLV